MNKSVHYCTYRDNLFKVRIYKLKRMFSEKTSKRIGTVNTEDIAFFLLTVIMSAMAVGGIGTTFFGYDLSTVFSVSLGPLSMTLVSILGIVGISLIAFTNEFFSDVDTAYDLFNAGDGLAFTGPVLFFIVDAWNPTFYQNIVNYTVGSKFMAGAFLVMSLVAVAAGYLATGGSWGGSH